MDGPQNDEVDNANAPCGSLCCIESSPIDSIPCYVLAELHADDPARGESHCQSQVDVSVTGPTFGRSVLIEVRPPTGEPYAGDPHVQFGGREPKPIGPPYPYLATDAAEVAIPKCVPTRTPATSGCWKISPT